MARYVCPEGDFEQEVPGICPTHGLDLEEMTDEGTSEESEGMNEEMPDEDMQEEEMDEDKDKENENW